VEDRDHDLLIRIDENLKSLVKSHSDHIQEDSRQFTTSDIRLTNVEKGYWKMMGGFMVIMAVGEYIMRVFFK